MHKPEIVARSLDLCDDFLIYLDADTFVRRSINEVIGSYDIGVTVGNPSEWSGQSLRINTGVIFFKNNDSTRNFVRLWRYHTETMGNDQAAFNYLVGGKVCRVAEFPWEIYNWDQFPKVPPHQAKILHYRISMHPVLGTFCEPDERRGVAEIISCPSPISALGLDRQ